MKFDATQSKLYQQIMDAAVQFLELDKETATETDVHAALDGKKPLAEQLEDARKDAIADLQKQFDDLKSASAGHDTAVADLQKQMDALKTEAKTKDDRITELQKEIAEARTATESLKKQHKTETDRLAGEIAKSKAGGALENDESGDEHDAGKPDKSKSSGAQVIVAKSSALQRLTKKPGA